MTLDNAPKTRIFTITNDEEENEMPKFKVGDRVRATRSVYYEDGIKIGQTGIIKAVYDDRYNVYPDVLNTFRSDQSWAFDEEHLELLKEETASTPEYSCIRVVPPSKPKREIVKGIVKLSGYAQLELKDANVHGVKINLDGFWLTSDALREAAALFTTLAEVLEENSNA